MRQKSNQKTARKLLTLCALIALGSGQVLAQTAKGESDNLLIMNTKFREIYLKAKNEAIAKSGPVIIVYFDRIALINGDKKEEEPTILDEFTTLKSIDHIPLALYSLLHGKSNLSEQDLKTLKEFAALVENGRADLVKHDLPKRTLDRQYRIIDKCRAIIEQCTKSGNLADGALQSLTRELAPDLLENAYEAISSQLKAIDKTMIKWKSTMSESDWSRFHVVIAGGHMPRQGNSNFQYFSRLLKEKEEGERVIYMEGLSQESDALALLGTHVLDEGVAVSFFKDKWRMHRDLLSDGATRYLREHPPLSTPSETK